MEKRWNIPDVDENAIRLLRESLKIHPALCRILIRRGILTFEQSKSFFRPEIKDLPSPWLMKDMNLAVERILTAFTSGEKILVYGDYDVDGTTSVACMYRFLKSVHTQVDFYIPHRYREGYGVSKAGIDFASANGFSLIVSLDCGIKSADLVSYASTLGIDFIICDHHLPDEIVPEAVAILNPKQKNCSYPYKELCGCGVGFKLICALTEKLDLPPDTPFEFLDLVATAIAADIVPITGENRILAWHGLKKANFNPNNGIRALCELSGVTKELNITSLVFMIAPRVNAAGRMDDAKKAVEMFIAKDKKDSLRFAEMLHSDNSDRREADIQITEQALTLISENTGWVNRKSTVVYQPHWHKGVVGIVASRLIEQYYRPTIVLTQSGEYAAGSARSVPGFNLYEAIHACREHLLGYGGHFAAAGMTLETSSIDAFREKFEEVVSKSITAEQLVPEIIIDAEISFREIQPGFYKIICQMEPFGPENMQPIFISRNVQNTGWSKIVKEEHIRFSVKQDDVIITGIGFGMSKLFPLLENKEPIDIVYKIAENVWNGNTSLQLQVIDIRRSVVNN